MNRRLSRLRRSAAFLSTGAALLAHAAGLAQPAPAPVVADSSAAGAIERARSLLLQHMETLEVPGMQIAVWRDGRLLWSEGLGWADRQRPKTSRAPSRTPRKGPERPQGRPNGPSRMSGYPL